ncbi:hypothetical protein [Streptomyces malaysiensis]|uniref:Uncharacterized protein n=1 Tax=Streptomyces malaysiensis subsp. samsunensis TaxID=459658 RepID=A0A9X2LWF6_STRMQ|nr:hypothetical protein [Streptomyces samsunensis]MCQ8831845.1 hypothetical protein [Streptomyces samsunensis]
MSERNDLRPRLVEALGNASKTHPCTCGSTTWSTCYHQGAPSNDERRATAVLEAVDSYIDEEKRKTVDMAALLRDAERIPALTAKVERAEEQTEQARRIAVELENQVAQLTSTDPWQRAVDGLNALVDAGVGFWIESDGHISNPTGSEHIEYDRETERWQLVHDEEA